MSLEKEIKEYLNQKGLIYKEVLSDNGGEFNLRQCPFCKDGRYHAFLNKNSGVFYCHLCGKGCAFLSFKQELKDTIPVQPMVPQEPKADVNMSAEVEEAHQALLASRKGMKYVWNRGFTKEAIEHFRLGFSLEEGIPFLWYPYICNGIPIGAKKRSIEGPKIFKRTPGTRSILFNGDVTKGSETSIILCEGESDVVAMWSAGITNVVGATVGAKSISDEWILHLDKFQKIYFAYDTDEEGQQGAYKFANRLGLERCYRVQLPLTIKDVNQFFMEGGDSRQMLRKIGLAKPFDVEHVSSVADQIKKGIAKWSITTQEDEDRIHFPWKKLDYLADGMMPGDLILLASRPGQGKTSMALNILYELAKIDIPGLLFELEMRPERLMPRLVAKHLGKDSKQVFNTEDLTKAYSEMQNLKLYLAYTYKKPTFDQVANTIRQCIRRYGIRLVVFDNLHFLCRSLTDQTREVSVIIQSFKLLAEELAIPILAIARPRKSTNKIITNLDLKDSADLESDSDIILLLHRDTKLNGETDYVGGATEGIFKEEMLVRVSKARYSAGGDCYIHVDDKTCRMWE